jgi:hypothetical protein
MEEAAENEKYAQNFGLENSEGHITVRLSEVEECH